MTSRWHRGARVPSRAFTRARDLAAQRRVAALRHPHLVACLGATADGRWALNERAPLGSLTNYDGSPAVLTRPELGGAASPGVLLEAAAQLCAAERALQRVRARGGAVVLT